MAVVEVVTPPPRDVWLEVLATDPGATVHQTPGWSDAMRSVTHAADASRLYLLEDGRRLILPMSRRTLFHGVVLEDSYPYGDLLATGGLRARDVRDVLADLVRNSSAVRTRLIANHGTADRWDAVRAQGVTKRSRFVHVLDLRDGCAGALRRFHRTARKQVHRAERSEVVVERNTEGRLIPSFYQLYRQWSADRARDSGLPRWLHGRAIAGRREPQQLFEAVAAELGDACRVWVAWLAGEAVAASISLVHGRHATFWRGYSRTKVAGPLGVMYLLDKLAIEDACEAGCDVVNMGQSSGIVGLERYKEAIGAERRPAAEYHIDRLGLDQLSALKNRLEAGVGRLISAHKRG